MSKSISTSANQHNIAEFNNLISSFLINDIDDIQDALFDTLAEYVANTDHDKPHVKRVTSIVGELVTFTTKLKDRYSFITKECKEVCHA